MVIKGGKSDRGEPFMRDPRRIGHASGKYAVIWNVAGIEDPAAYRYMEIQILACENLRIEGDERNAEYNYANRNAKRPVGT